MLMLVHVLFLVLMLMLMLMGMRILLSMCCVLCVRLQYAVRRFLGPLCAVCFVLYTVNVYNMQFSVCSVLCKQVLVLMLTP